MGIHMVRALFFLRNESQIDGLKMENDPLATCPCSFSVFGNSRVNMIKSMIKLHPKRSKNIRAYYNEYTTFVFACIANASNATSTASGKS